MALTIILIIVFSALSCFLCYKCLRPRLQSAAQLDAQTTEHNAWLQQQNNELSYRHEELLQIINNKITEQRVIEEKIAEQKNTIKLLQEQSQQSADVFYHTNLEIAQTHLEQSLEIERVKYCREIEKLKNALLAAQEESVSAYLNQIAETRKEIDTLTQELAQKRADTEAAIKAAKRAEEMKESKDFYRIKLTQEDIEEIKKLRSILPYLRNKEPLNKVIWKAYYEKPLNDLIGRVIGPGIHTGIYKITDIENDKCYVGQSSNLADRWKQHVKRGVGAETQTRNKLYPAMLEKGPENFTFEVLEECDRADLDAREDYFQEFYQAMTWGYSIK